MSNFVIEDGTGNGYQARVSDDNRLFVESVTYSERDEASLDGYAFNINTGIITLTSANKSALLYFKNASTTHNAIISKIIYLFGNPTSGTGDSLITVIKNPTAGTIVSNAVAVEMNENKNFGSTRTFTSLAYKGAEGYTITDGSKIIESIFSNTATRTSIEVGNMIIQNNKSIGIEYTPPTGTTSQQVEIAIEIYYKKI